MSLILEALRRSEAERRLGETPGLHAPDAWRALPGRGGVRERARWPWIALGLVLAMALAAAAGAWWMRVEQAATGTPMAGAPAPVAAPAAPTAAAPSMAAPATAPMTLPAPAPRIDAPAAAPAVVAPPVVMSAPAPVPAAPPASAPADERPPPLAALDPARRAALPPLRLGLHLWDAAPERRRVVIDGQRHLEGAWITPDVRLVAIVRGGCILEIDGRRWWLGVA